METIRFGDPVPLGLSVEAIHTWLHTMRTSTKHRYETLKGVLESIFARRPVWIRRTLDGLEEVRSIATHNLLSQVLGVVAFQYGSGPFKGLLVRAGEWGVTAVGDVSGG